MTTLASLLHALSQTHDLALLGPLGDCLEEMGRGDDAAWVRGIEIVEGNKPPSPFLHCWMAIYPAEKGTAATQWHPTKDGMAEQLSRIVLERFTTPCKPCGGTGQINTGPGDYGDEYVPCDPCDGTGFRLRGERRQSQKGGDVS